MDTLRPVRGILQSRQDCIKSRASLVAQLVEKSTCHAGDLGSIPGLGRSPGERNPLQYSGLENNMDCIVWEVAESDTTERLSRICQLCPHVLHRRAGRTCVKLGGSGTLHPPPPLLPEVVGT